jgi:hypothetical protein
MLCHALNRVLFPSWSSFVEEMLLAMVKKTMDHMFGQILDL